MLGPSLRMKKKREYPPSGSQCTFSRTRLVPQRTFSRTLDWFSPFNSLSAYYMRSGSGALSTRGTNLHGLWASAPANVFTDFGLVPQHTFSSCTRLTNDTSYQCI